MNKDILVIGRTYLGNRITKYLDCAQTDLGIEKSIVDDIKARKPKAIINCLGNNGDDIDGCEKKATTLGDNTLTPIVLAEACYKQKIKLVHISSGDLFHYNHKEQRPLKETEYPDFFDSFYSRTKIYTEAVLLALGDKANILIIRPRLLLDYIPNDSNLLSKLISFKNVTDIENSVTYVPDFLEALRHLLKLDAQGVYNVVNYGGLRYRELLEVYRQYYPNHAYAIDSQSELKIVRTNLLLSTDKLEESGFEVTDIHDRIGDCIAKYVAMLKGAKEEEVASVLSQNSGGDKFIAGQGALLGLK